MTHTADPSMHAQPLVHRSYILGAVLVSIQLFTINVTASKSNMARYTRQLSGVNLDMSDLPYQIRLSPSVKYSNVRRNLAGSKVCVASMAFATKGRNTTASLVD